ncbi:MAG: nuclear transport factor 2 family protein [Proteobacteria bacterium]|nr:nuclear transport factor 2 family protein [Pseudomonadota bacterium]MDA1290066.1 nuclear transport factor 2 family protein [Pseudomonadota bacterium]
MKNISLLILLSFTLFSCAQNSQSQQSDIAAINKVLDGYHQAAANGEWDIYFDLMSDDGVFIGIDAQERWVKAEFRQYSSGSNGWVYAPQQRNVNITPDGLSAWFDEALLSQSYGSSRGSGVLIRTAQGWKISQYHLTLPIPNGMVRGITDQIKEYEAQD